MKSVGFKIVGDLRCEESDEWSCPERAADIDDLDDFFRAIVADAFDFGGAGVLAIEGIAQRVVVVIENNSAIGEVEFVMVQLEVASGALERHSAEVHVFDRGFSFVVPCVAVFCIAGAFECHMTLGALAFGKVIDDLGQRLTDEKRMKNLGGKGGFDRDAAEWSLDEKFTGCLAIGAGDEDVLEEKLVVSHGEGAAEAVEAGFAKNERPQAGTAGGLYQRWPIRLELEFAIRFELLRAFNAESAWLLDVEPCR